MIPGVTPSALMWYKYNANDLNANDLYVFTSHAILYEHKKDLAPKKIRTPIELVPSAAFGPSHVREPNQNSRTAVN